MRPSPALLLVLALAPTAMAQDEPGTRVVYPEKTEIEMDGVEIDAPVVRPSIELVGDTRRGHFPPIFHLREDFDLEMAESVDEVK